LCGLTSTAPVEEPSLVATILWWVHQLEKVDWLPL
jgi:hypothetical protein